MTFSKGMPFLVSTSADPRTNTVGQSIHYFLILVSQVRFPSLPMSVSYFNKVYDIPRRCVRFYVSIFLVGTATFFAYVIASVSLEMVSSILAICLNLYQ